ncbi:LysR family transcriptional regulator [Oceanimonas baumannii]|uniref:DNA-binding transcriptional LysR family regulator n=1 Tax=Oceanimonas baumannii TaxID=129578 RepID=A0A235CMU1_9GAMM|nr:LysR family transcriptional regulator [Oceanimonas baumannii]OYD25756.1 LysR family transcriptional regulator [Oceanimonas baumannii]TDW60237.1 DNA-binding transcriptional LysR family regulator [Oceanimonas baumannii]
MSQTNRPVLSQIGDYEIRLLKLFKTVVECGGFSAAETELNISRSTISVHMANLESRLKLKLCRRGRSGFSLTDDGEVIYDSTKRLFSRLEEFRYTVNELHEQLSGELKIVSSDSIWLEDEFSMVKVFSALGEQAPDVNVSVDVAYMGEIERRVLSDEADIGFIHYHRDLEGLDYHHLYQVRCFLYCSDRHPLFAEQDDDVITERLPEFKLIHPGIHTNPETSAQLAGMKLAGRAYHYEPRAALILSGQYIGFLPESYARRWVDNGRLRPLLPRQKTHLLGISAITRSHGRQSRIRQLFLQLIKDQLSQG